MLQKLQNPTKSSKNRYKICKNNKPRYITQLNSVSPLRRHYQPELMANYIIRNKVLLAAFYGIHSAIKLILLAIIGANYSLDTIFPVLL